MRRIVSCASVLALPLAFLLWAQWPLRDLVQAHARLANDLGQIVFAVYAAVAVTAATLAGTHLAAHGNTTDTTHGPRWKAWATLLCVAPWAAFLLWVGVPQAWTSLVQWEKFAETFTPGYFLLRWALVLLAALALWQSIAQLMRRPAPSA